MSSGTGLDQNRGIGTALWHVLSALGSEDVQLVLECGDAHVRLVEESLVGKPVAGEVEALCTTSP